MRSDELREEGGWMDPNLTHGIGREAGHASESRRKIEMATVQYVLVPNLAPAGS